MEVALLVLYSAIQTILLGLVCDRLKEIRDRLPEQPQRPLRPSNPEPPR